MLSFAEEIFLLALDDERGIIKPLPVSAFDYALAGAILMDLAIRDRIDTDAKTLSLANPSPTGDPILDDALEDLRRQPEPLPTSQWLKHFADQSRRIQDRVLTRLVDKGILKQVNRRILWVFEVRRYPLQDNREIKEVRTRLHDLLLSDEIPDPREVVLITLGNACRLLDDLFAPDESERARARIAALSKLDLIGQEMAASIREIERIMAIAMSMTMMA